MTRPTNAAYHVAMLVRAWVFVTNHHRLASIATDLSGKSTVCISRILLAFVVFAIALVRHCPADDADKTFQHFLWSQAHRIPAELTSEESGYFSIVEGLNKRLYIGTAKYGENAYLVEFDPVTDKMKVVVDAESEIGVDRKGFAAQAKIHTRNNVGRSGKIYFGTKQGYPQKGEERSAYLGGYPMVYDPQTAKTRVYDIPVRHHGIISVTPDERRNVAGIGCCTVPRLMALCSFRWHQVLVQDLPAVGR